MPKKKPDKGRKRAKPRSGPLVNLNLVKALDHELRQRILQAAILGEVSPSELSKSLGEELSKVSYHVKVLRDDCGGILRRTRTEQRRGAVENYYRANPEVLQPAESVAGIFALLEPEPAWDPDELSALIATLKEASEARLKGK